MTLIWTYTGTDLSKKILYKHPFNYTCIEVTINSLPFMKSVYSQPIYEIIRKYGTRIIPNDQRISCFDLMIAVNSDDEIYIMESLNVEMLAQLKLLLNIYSKLFQDGLLIGALESVKESCNDFKKSLTHQLKTIFKEVGIHEILLQETDLDEITYYNQLATQEGIYQIYSGLTTFHKILCTCMFSIPNEVIYFRISKKFFE